MNPPTLHNEQETGMRHLIHKIICWYLRKCGGAFHAFPYGTQGRYVVLMNDDQYHGFKEIE